MRVIGFTGTRAGMTGPQRETLRRLLVEYDFFDMAIHGGCDGADWEFHCLVREVGQERLKAELVARTGRGMMAMVSVYPSELPHSYPPPILGAVRRGELLTQVWNRYGASIVYLPQPPLQRNKQMVDFVARHGGTFFATPKTEIEELRSGTWATIRAALKRSRGPAPRVQEPLGEHEGLVLKVVYPNGGVG